MEAQIFMLNKKKRERGIHNRPRSCREQLISLHGSSTVSPTRSIVAGRLEMFFSLMHSTTEDGRRVKVWRGSAVEGVSLATVGFRFFCFLKVSGVEEGHVCTKVPAVSCTRTLETGEPSFSANNHAINQQQSRKGRVKSKRCCPNIGN